MMVAKKKVIEAVKDKVIKDYEYTKARGMAIWNGDRQPTVLKNIHITIDPTMANHVAHENGEIEVCIPMDEFEEVYNEAHDSQDSIENHPFITKCIEYHTGPVKTISYAESVDFFALQGFTINQDLESTKDCIESYLEGNTPETLGEYLSKHLSHDDIARLKASL